MPPADVLLDPGARPVIGHRGTAAHAPENTLESFRLAAEQGVDAFELDVQLTADGEVVVLHDPAVDRTTDGAGAIGALTLAQVQALDAGARWTADGGRTWPWRGRGARIPTLAELLDEFPSMPLMIDAKSLAVAAPLARLLERHGARDRTLVGSFDARCLVPFAGRGWHRMATREQSVALLLRAIVGGVPPDTDYVALSIPTRVRGVPLPMTRLAGAARRAGRVLHVWTVNDARQARALWEAGVQGLVSDDPVMLRRVRAGLGPSAPAT